MPAAKGPAGARSAAVPKGAVALTGLSAARVGEHIVKGTCHICHDATGPGGGHSAMAQGIIPSLASIPRDHSLNGVVHQVQYGSSGMMKMAGAEVMPAYPYFTQEEIAAAYLVGYGTGNAAQRGVAADRVSPCQTAPIRGSRTQI